jgi:hypothetical protein
VVDVSGRERVIGPGVYPFWGGTRTIRVRVAKSVGAAALRRGRVTIRPRGGPPSSTSAQLRVRR